ncbi:MAG: alpha-1,2-fucosyltransferase [Alphaproteobacteria bacterium]|nr:alpha-1,2-fucosyltransferase [Alphaproteobacteria bacterium]
MKIVKLMGGLGNQMFQYAFGYALGRISGDKVLYDASWFDWAAKNPDKVTVRKYELGVFNANVEFATNDEIKRALSRSLFKMFPIVREPDSMFHQRLLRKSGNYFEGYFQCDKYFCTFREDILNAFQLRDGLDKANSEICENIKSCNSVSLHIRRGDYINLPDIYGSCDLSYYTNALDIIASRAGTPNVFVFSDDKDWVKDNLKIKYPWTMVDINDGSRAFMDIELMRNCRHNIIANSSFSWWGAWLNQNPDKIVIAPTNWFSNGAKTDIILDSWLKI